jgi:hypothetical protein
MLTKEQALKLLKQDMDGTAEALISLAIQKGVDPETLYQGYIDDIVETASILEEEADVDYAHKVWVENVNKLQGGGDVERGL